MNNYLKYRNVLTRLLNNRLNNNNKLNLQIIRLNSQTSSNNNDKTNPSSTSSSEASQSKPPLDLRKLRINKSKSGEGSRYDDINYVGAILLTAIPIATFFLGIWQIRRREWKIGLIEMLEQRTAQPPIPLPKDLQELENPDYEYRAFKVKGKFDHSREVLITMRSDITETYNVPGAYVVTPFTLSDRNLTILVNRGFIPYSKYKVENRKDAQIENEIELVGVLRRDEITNAFSPKNRPHLNEWYSRNIQLIAVTLDTAPIFLDATIDTTLRKPVTNEPIGPLGGQTVVNLRNEHLSYILTWFTLSGLTSIMWYKNFGKILFKL